MKTADLHTHSTFSDGTCTPEEIVTLANKKGLSAIALTDHDTLDGTEEAVYRGEKLGVEVVKGVEISTDFESTHLHIVGLFIKDDKELSSALEKLRKARVTRNLRMTEKINALGFDLDYNKDVVTLSGGAVVTRAHIAKAMAKKGYVSSVKEAFDRFLDDDRPAYVKKEVMDYKTSLQLIKESGGISVLAHPFYYKLPEEEIERTVDELIKYGLGAIEAYYTTHSEKQTQYVKDLAERKGLLISGGSDFHGANKPGIDLGTGYGDLKIPYTVFENLKKFSEESGKR